MNQWITQYVAAQKAALDSVPAAGVERAVSMLRQALVEDRQVFVFGNGGSASNASHFATDLGKGASDKLGRPFRVLSLNDNVSWMLALANDYSYPEVFSRQLANYGRAGDVAIGVSVSGGSPNVVGALEWARDHGLKTLALVGAKRGRMAQVAGEVIVVEDTHYGRVEDAQMGVLHMLCYAFMEIPELQLTAN